MEIELKELIVRIEEDIKQHKKYGDGPDDKSYGYEQGILLSARECKVLIKAAKIATP